jgi:hypothetical protein
MDLLNLPAGGEDSDDEIQCIEVNYSVETEDDGTIRCMCSSFIKPKNLNKHIHTQKHKNFLKSHNINKFNINILKNI